MSESLSNHEEFYHSHLGLIQHFISADFTKVSSLKFSIDERSSKQIGRPSTYLKSFLTNVVVVEATLSSGEYIGNTISTGLSTTFKVELCSAVILSNAARPL